MASLYPKKVNGGTYWYLREMARVGGKPKMVSERYVGSAAEIEALLDGRDTAMAPERTRHLAFGNVAAAWGMIQDLGVIAAIDAAAGPNRAVSTLSTGTYLALAALNRLVARCSKAAFADWWKTTAADRFTKIPPRRWTTAGSGTRCTPSPPQMLEQASEATAAEMVRARADRRLQRGAGHDELRHVHRHLQRKAPIAQRGRRSRSGPTCGSWAWAWSSPGTAGSR